MGSNMAECHPVAFRWPLKAKTEHGAVLMHVDPRFTHTSALCDIHAAIRAGTDIVFLGAIINHVIHSERGAPQDGPDTLEPAHRLSDPGTALLPVHTRNGGKDLRLPEGKIPEGGRVPVERARHMNP